MYPEYEAEVRALEADVCAHAAPGVVAFYGASSIRLWDTLESDFPDVPLVNLGFGGSTLAACAYYFGRLIAPLRPRALVLFAGENDLAEGATPDRVLAAWDDLHRQVTALPSRVPFAYLSVKPSPARIALRSSMEEVNRRIEALARAREETHFVDVYTPMLKEDGSPRRELWTDDGIHLNPDGYGLWWQILSARRRELGF